MTEPIPDRFLRYWAVNMNLARLVGQTAYPGFSYTTDDYERFAGIAGFVPTAAVVIWLAATVLLYLIGAAVLVFVDFFIIVARLWPDPAAAPEWAFFVLMGSTGFLGLSIIMPLSIAGGGWLADTLTGAPAAPVEPSDAALAAKVRHQFFRVAAVAAALMVPVALVFTWLGPAADAIIGWLRIASIVLAVASAVFGVVSRRYRRAAG